MSFNELSSDMQDKIMDMVKCGMCGDLDDSCGCWQCEECQKTFDKHEGENPKDSGDLDLGDICEDCLDDRTAECECCEELIDLEGGDFKEMPEGQYHDDCWMDVYG